MTLALEASVDASLSESRARARVQGASLREILRGRCLPSMGGGIRAWSPPSTGVCMPGPDALPSVGTRSRRPLLLASSSCRTTLRLPSACSDEAICHARGRGLPSVDGWRACAVDASRLGAMQTEQSNATAWGHARPRPSYLHTRLAGPARAMAAPRVTRRPASARMRKAPWAFLHESDSGPACSAPGPRPHTPSYHRPLLLDTPASAQQLLAWFDATQHDRDMPWRQPWMDPDAPLPKRVCGSASASEAGGAASRTDALQKRAYEVWISEIMLQQTRVETVRSYWHAWMDKWPTIEALAQASLDDVLAAWRGLGYYGRARRIHEAAQKVVRELGGCLPEYADALGRDIPGIGPYTAGAISSIVFGHAVPILDGNVARVLSRQTGLYADPRAKSTADLQWELARLLVESVAPGRPSDVPGRWNQGLMELGSTLCTPTRPGCEECPIQATCRAYAEGTRYEASLTTPSETPAVPCVDVEDLCTQCVPLPDPADADAAPGGPAPKSAKKLTQMTLQGLAAAPPTRDKGRGAVPLRIRYAQLFPMRVAKQMPRCEVRRVCVVRYSSAEGSSPMYLLHQRPHEGLLASLWEFPTEVLPDEPGECDPQAMERGARAFVEALDVPSLRDAPITLRADAAQYLGTVRHEFSHLHWLMHVVLTDVSLGPPAPPAPGETVRARQWLDGPGVADAPMGSGLRRCWALALART